MDDRLVAAGGGAADAGARSGGAALGAGLVSSHWYRVAGLAPRLREQLRLHAQRWRGEAWVLVEDRVNARYHRFDRQAWRIIRLLDGKRTLEQLWQQLAAQPDEDAPSQEDLLALLGQLHALDLLAADAVPDLAELAQRDRRQLRRRFASRWLNPFAIRVPLVDPDRWLQKLVRWLRPVLNRRGAWLWLALVLPALLLVPPHWRELGGNFSERLLALDNLLLLLVIFPLVKALHEIGHGVACRLGGGEVHDMGVMLLLLLPVPYVEASSSWAFPDKRARMLVGAAGMLVELAIAAIAFYLWLALEPGLARAIAFDVALLASVTTVVFNANPLLRYDGYYVLSDWLEIPNLAQRAGRWWGWLAERWLIGRREATSPARSRTEALWLALYAPVAFAYRMVVLFSIAIFLATQYFAVGVLVAVWGLVVSLALPLVKGGRWLAQQLHGPAAPRRGRRALAALAAVAVLLLFALPLPRHTQVDGVLWLPDDALLRAGQAGFIEDLALRDGAPVQPGELVLALDNPTLAAQIGAQLARTQAAQVRYDAAYAAGPVELERQAVLLRHEQNALADLQARAQQLQLRAASAGRLWLGRGDDLIGVFAQQGDLLGYVMPDAAPRVRVIVDQADAALIRSQTRAIEVRLPFATGRSWPVRVLRAVPAASHELPSAALGRTGGGAAATDPRDDSGRRSVETYFELELGLPDDFPYRLAGARVGVRFEHPSQALAPRIWLGLRRLFLRHFQT